MKILPFFRATSATSRATDAAQHCALMSSSVATPLRARLLRQRDYSYTLSLYSHSGNEESADDALTAIGRRLGKPVATFFAD